MAQDIYNAKNFTEEKLFLRVIILAAICNYYIIYLYNNMIIYNFGIFFQDISKGTNSAVGLRKIAAE